MLAYLIEWSFEKVYFLLQLSLKNMYRIHFVANYNFVAFCSNQKVEPNIKTNPKSLKVLS